MRDFGGLSGGPRFAPALPQAKKVSFPAGLAQSLQGDYSSMQGLIRLKAKGKGLATNIGGNWLDCSSDGKADTMNIFGVKLKRE
jgi:hypothetical protein